MHVSGIDIWLYNLKKDIFILQNVFDNSIFYILHEWIKIFYTT